MIPLPNGGSVSFTEAHGMPPLAERRGGRLMLSGEGFVVTVEARAPMRRNAPIADNDRHAPPRPRRG